MTKEGLVRKYKHKLKRAEAKAAEYGRKEDRLSPHGKWSQGWYDGRVQLLDDVLEDLEELI